MQDPHPAHAAQINDLERARKMIQSAFADTAALIETHMEATRYKSIALMRLEEGVLWANQDISKQIVALKQKSINARR